MSSEINRVRVPAVAGYFYPAEKEELERMISGFFDTVEKDSERKNNDRERVNGVIAPHAGYVYSGISASYSYRVLKNEMKNRNIKRVFLLGPSHHYPLSFCALEDYDFWKTPFGTIKVDKELRKELEKTNEFETFAEAHAEEHSLEVQVPFIQFILKKLKEEKIKKELKIVPIVMNVLPYKILIKVADILSEFKEDSFFIISSDLSHYMPQEVAEKIDNETISNILNLNVEGKLDACGKTPIKIAIEMCRTNKWKPKLLDYRTSGDYNKDYSQVVGYCSIVF